MSRGSAGGRLTDRVCAITGATSGIGEATARRFLAEGAFVVLAGTNETKGEAIATELGDRAVFVRADVSREAAVAGLVDAAVERFGRLDCLFSNAGVPFDAALETVTEAEFDTTMRVLLGSVVFGIKHAARVMKPAGGGCVITTSGSAAHRAAQGHYLYSAAKAAVSHVTHLAAVELGPFNVRVNAISPAAILTPIYLGGADVADTMSSRETRKQLERVEQNLAKATPLPRAGDPADVASAALFLASDEGSFVNGHDLVVDGGRIWASH